MVASECSNSSVLISFQIPGPDLPLVLKPSHQERPPGGSPSLTVAEVTASLAEHFSHIRRSFLEFQPEEALLDFPNDFVSTFVLVSLNYLEGFCFLR